MEQKFKIIEVRGTPEWMISFGDLMSCLLVFFVLLLTFSSAKPGKLMDMMGEYVDGGIADEETRRGDIIGSAGENRRIAVDEKDEAPMRLANLILSHKFHEFKEKIHSLGFKYDIRLNMLSEGLSMEVAEDDLFFANGESFSINPEAMILVQTLANVAVSGKREFRAADILRAADKAEYSSNSVWRAERRLGVLAGVFKNDYHITDDTLTQCVGFSDKNKKNMMCFLVAERVEGKPQNMSDIIKIK
jgi:flagellar motor protein MotB